jgi:1-acyl-sn-glycerol-3-phosphate acyltransferase
LKADTGGDQPQASTGTGGTRPPENEIVVRVLTVLRDLIVELQPHRAGRLSVALDSDLDRDLGLDSLGRAELVLRLDRAFSIKLPESLIADAETAQDLCRAVAAARPEPIGRPGPAPMAPAILPDVSEPKRAQTLIDALAVHADERGDRPHILLWVDDETEETITYRALERGARAVAAGLLEHGVSRGDRIAIMLPTGRSFFECFFGILMAGGVPVPIYPPFRRAQIEDHLRRQAGILRNAAASIIITDERIRPLGGLLMGLAGDLRALTTRTALQAHGAMAEPMPAGPETVALIQYTSGSTGDPKGVVLTHGNLLANIRAMGEALQASAHDVFVSWLPLYHDMGLIGAWLGSLYYSAPVAIMPPLAFLARPARWLRLIHRHRATLSAAPNFAFELCLKSIRDDDIAGLDLSSLRMVMNGAEPVSRSTIRGFAERFARYGFRPEAMAPVYGLAECSVGLAFPPVGRGPVIDRVQRVALSTRGIAEPAPPTDESAVEFVACGRPIPRHEIRIVDETGRELPDRRQGRLQFRGPSATKGYFRAEEKTKSLFDGDWLETGDLAYVSAGDVFITGRIKDMIIRAGRNLYPHELEEFIGRIEGVRRGCVVAFACPDRRTGTERLIVLAETRLTDSAARDRLRARIMDASLALLDQPPDLVLLVPPRTVPKTSSGKLRRSAARALYESGIIASGHRPLWWQLARLSLSGLAGRLRQFARIAGAFSYAFYWWAALAIIGLPTWLAVVVAPARAWRFVALRAAARTFFAVTGIRLDVRSVAPIPDRNAVVVANHSSYLDVLALLVAIPGPSSFVAKDQLRRQFIAGTLLRRLGTVFVRRADPAGGIEDTDAVLAAARRGERIVTFPEGTFTRMPGLLGFRMGAFTVAAQAGVPVYPTTIQGTRSLLRSGQWIPTAGRITVSLGSAVRADSSDFRAAMRLRDAVRTQILLASGEPDLAGERIELPPD